MQPIAPLMIEHRLIERMIELIRRQIRAMEESNRANHGFIESAIDFIRIYADRTHHGKEEGILFRECERKEMAAGDAKMKKELVEEHAYARGVVGDLADALNKYRGGQKEYLGMMLDKLNALATFYPVHIEKEDTKFFPSSMNYFDKAEQDSMLREFFEFDRKIIHEKYRAVVDRWENEKKI